MNLQDLQTRLERIIAKSRRRILKFTAKKRNQRRMLYAAGAVMIVVLGAGLIVSQVSSHNNSLEYQLRQKSWQTARIKLTGELKKTQSEKATTEAAVQAKATHEADLQKQIDDLNQQLQAKRAAAASIASRVVNTITGTQTAYAAPATSSGTVSGCGDNSYANFIYMHESGCRLNATNAGGCVGIGQACPGSKLYAVCPDLNYACQNAFFTAYANAAYGGWGGAYAFWQSHSWW